jgi:hypothetical protein
MNVRIVTRASDGFFPVLMNNSKYQTEFSEYRDLALGTAASTHCHRGHFGAPASRSFATIFYAVDKQTVESFATAAAALTPCRQLSSFCISSCNTSCPTKQQ